MLVKLKCGNTLSFDQIDDFLLVACLNLLVLADDVDHLERDVFHEHVGQDFLRGSGARPSGDRKQQETPSESEQAVQHCLRR